MPKTFLTPEQITAIRQAMPLIQPESAGVNFLILAALEEIEDLRTELADKTDECNQLQKTLKRLRDNQDRGMGHGVIGA